MNSVPLNSPAGPAPVEYSPPAQYGSAAYGSAAYGSGPAPVEYDSPTQYSSAAYDSAYDSAYNLAAADAADASYSPASYAPGTAGYSVPVDYSGGYSPEELDEIVEFATTAAPADWSVPVDPAVDWGEGLDEGVEYTPEELEEMVAAVTAPPTDGYPDGWGGEYPPLNLGSAAPRSVHAPVPGVLPDVSAEDMVAALVTREGAQMDAALRAVAQGPRPVLVTAADARPGMQLAMVGKYLTLVPGLTVDAAAEALFDTLAAGGASNAALPINDLQRDLEVSLRAYEITAPDQLADFWRGQPDDAQWYFSIMYGVCGLVCAMAVAGAPDGECAARLMRDVIRASARS